MKKSRFTDNQIIHILKENENGVAVTDLCRKYGMSAASFYKWRSKYGGMDASMLRRVKELEAENAKLKKMYAESKMEAEIIKEALEGKLSSHLQGDRWQNLRWINTAFQSVRHVDIFRFQGLAIDTRLNHANSTIESQTGLYDLPQHLEIGDLDYVSFTYEMKRR